MAARLRDTDLVSRLLHGTPQPCDFCLSEAVTATSTNNSNMLELLLDAGADVSVHRAVLTGNLRLLRRVIQTGERFTLDEVWHVLGQADLDFIMHALDLYHEENGSSSNQWSKQDVLSGHHSNQFDPSPSLGLQANVQRHFPQSTFGDSQELLVERRILRAVLALPEHKHKSYLSKCLNGAVQANSENLIQLLIHEGAIASMDTLALAVREKDSAIFSILIRSFCPSTGRVYWLQMQISCSTKR